MYSKLQFTVASTHPDFLPKEDPAKIAAGIPFVLAHRLPKFPPPGQKLK